MSGDRAIDHETWPRAATAFEEFFAAVRELTADRVASVGLIREKLHGPQRTAALFVLRLLDTDYLVELVDDLVHASISDRDGRRTRELLGMLPHAQAVDVVPPAVWRQLRRCGDDDDQAYLALGTLLEHLGLTTALDQLVERAQDSQNPHVRDVVEFFPHRGSP